MGSEAYRVRVASRIPQKRTAFVYTPREEYVSPQQVQKSQPRADSLPDHQVKHWAGIFRPARTRRAPLAIPESRGS